MNFIYWASFSFAIAIILSSWSFDSVFVSERTASSFLISWYLSILFRCFSSQDLDGKSKANLDGHLKSDDFFGVEKFPTATLVIKSLGEKGNGVYAVTADLTIKGKTESIKFDLTVGKNTAETSLKVDRTKYGIQYGSGSFFDNLGDKTISDEFELKVKLVF